MVVGGRVVRGHDWKWDNQDGGEGSVGVIQGEILDGWVHVKWDNGESNRYRMGAQDSYDVRLVDPGAAGAAEAVDALEGVEARAQGVARDLRLEQAPPHPKP